MARYYPNLIIVDELEGDMVELFAAESITDILRNKGPDSTIEVHGERQKTKVLRDKIKAEAERLSIVASLAGDPGVASGGIGGAGYEFEQYQHLRDFAKRRTSFTVMDTMLPNSFRSGVQVEFYNMMIEECSFIKDKESRNIIGARLELREVIYTPKQGPGKYPQSPLELGLQETQRLVGGLLDTFMLPLKWALDIIVGFFNLLTGSIPRQRWSTRIGGERFDFELAWSDATVLWGTGIDDLDLDRPPKVTDYSQDFTAARVHAGMTLINRYHPERRTEIIAVPSAHELRIAKDIFGRPAQNEPYRITRGVPVLTLSQDGEVLLSDMLIYGQDFLAPVDHQALNDYRIVPLDPRGEVDVITEFNFGGSLNERPVQLWLLQKGAEFAGMAPPVLVEERLAPEPKGPEDVPPKPGASS